MGHGLYRAEITVIHSAVGKAVEQPSHLVFVGRFDCPETHGEAVLEGMGRGDFLGIAYSDDSATPCRSVATLVFSSFS
jgi:hypothetical protein